MSEPAQPLDDVAQARARPRWLHVAANAVLLLVALQILLFLLTNPRFEWTVVAEYLTAATVLKGLGVSIVLTAIGMALGTVLGTLLALLKLGTWRTGRWFAGFYTWLFRGTPVRTVGAIVGTLAGRGDPKLVFDAEIAVDLPTAK